MGILAQTRIPGAHPHSNSFRRKIMISIAVPAVATVTCLHFLRVKKEAGFQRYLKRLTHSTHLHYEGGKEE